MTNSSVNATVRYLVPGMDRPIYFASRGGADAALRIGAKFEDREVTIHNARRLDPPARLDLQGFTLVSHASRVEDFYSLDVVQSAYEAEIAERVVAATGADSVRVFDHTLRSDSREVRGKWTSREPATVIHNDYTDTSAAKRIRDLLPPEEADERLRRRFAIVNLWRTISGPVLSSPLACCDATTVAESDLVASERRSRDRTGELQLVKWNPSHRWYYYPEMRPDEALLFKTFDSALDEPARRTIHTAFENPLAPADAPARESIESRMFAFFE